MVIRLQSIRPNWNWTENINPESLSSISLAESIKEGIYNAAAVFCTERSKFTQGLEKELIDFKPMNVNDYNTVRILF